jgi:hypothetical protein
MMHEIQSFAPFTHDRWQRLKAALLAKTGLDINDDKGVAEALDSKVSYEFDAAAGTLTLQTLDKPWGMAEFEVDQMIHVFVEKNK